jgi:urease accessory protein
LNGSLFLRAGVRDGRTVLLDSRSTYPLQVLRPHAEPVRGGISLVLLLLSAGLLDGDCVSMEVVLEPGARLALRTQAATQVHAGRSQQHLRVAVGEGGVFSYVPHALVPHADAEYHALTAVHMAADARAFVAEALSPGRVQFGEQFAYREVRLDLDAHYTGALVARERATIRPAASLRCAQWAQFTHVASAYLLGPGDSPEPGAAPGIRVGVSELAHHGWFVRALAHRASHIDDLLTRLAADWWRSCAL